MMRANNLLEDCDFYPEDDWDRDIWRGNIGEDSLKTMIPINSRKV